MTKKNVRRAENDVRRTKKTTSEGLETAEKRCQNDQTDGRKTMSEEQLYGRGSVVFFGDFDEFDESLNHRISDSSQKTLCPESHL